MDHGPNPAFGDLLRGYRAAAGLTQEELAERAGVSPRGIGDLERARRSRPRRDTIRLLADALRLETAERVRFEAAARPGGPPAPEAVRPGGGYGALAPGRYLPVPVTSFVGRERERTEVRRLLGEARLVTLTGAGGCGKTRLAYRVAADLVGTYADGVWLAELAPLVDPDLVAPTVAGALGVPGGADRPVLARLVDALRERRLLLILDNCEHLIDACARLADALLRGCPDVRILATSREKLRIAGETSCRVPSLAVPPDDVLPPPVDLARVEAVRLFVDRAQAVRPGFALTDRNAAAVAQICRRLDGIPLAVELAAARLHGLSAEQLAARLDQRFRLLSAGSRVALPRQQTLEATVAWSYALLTEAERTLFGRLAVFVGGFTVEAAETVGGDPPLSPDGVLDLLLRLVDKSLVVAEPGEDGAERYRLLETLREYGGERLGARGEAELVARRHAELYLALAEEAESPLRGPGQIAWLARLDRERHNLRAALGWLSAHDRPVEALRLAAALGLFWTVRGHYAEGRARLTELLARVPAPREPALRARAYRGLASLAGRQGDYPEAARYRDAFQGAAAEAGDRALLAEALALGARFAVVTDSERAAAQIHEALALAGELGLRVESGLLLVHLGLATAARGDANAAGARIAAGLALLREAGDAARLALGLNFACKAAIARGDYRGARGLAEEYAPIVRALGDRSGQANCRMYRAEAAWGEGDAATAEALLAEASGIYQDIADHLGVAAAAAGLSRAALRRGDVAQAGARAAQGLALVRRHGMHAELLTIALRAAGDAALARGDVEAAASCYREGLALPTSRGTEAIRLCLIEGLAAVAAVQRRPARALRLAGAAAAGRAGPGAGASPLDRDRLERALAPARQVLRGTAARAAYAEGQAMSPEHAIAYALIEEGGPT